MSLVPPPNRSFMDTASRYSQGAIQARSAMRPDVTIDPPGKTAGGALSSGIGMGMAGYMVAGMSKGGMTGPQGALVGAGLGLATYLLS